MAKIELPPRLVSDVENGNIVLMLGAGASLGATSSDGTHARQLFVMGKTRERRPLFAKLRRARMDPVAKRTPRMLMPGTFTGVIDKLEVTYARIRRDGDAEWIFVNRENVTPGQWSSLSIGTNVRFEIWFSIYGAVAQGVVLK